MKFAFAVMSLVFVSMNAFAVENALSTAVSTPASSSSPLKNTVAFNFAGLAQGRTNVYLDIGGLSSVIAPALSFRSYSNQEVRKQLGDVKATADRTLATLGASLTVLRFDNKSLLVNPYLYFGTEKDALSTANLTGPGLRVVGQAYLEKTIGLQLGIDANTMEGPFKGEAYIGLAIAL